MTPDARLAVAAYADGTIRWHRMEDGAELLAFFPHADKERWVAWTPQGHYMASPGGEDLIGWQVNRGFDEAPEYFPASTFSKIYNRPDVVTRVLDELDVDRAVARADAERGVETLKQEITTGDLPVQVRIAEPADDQLVPDDVELTYYLKGEPAQLVSAVRFRVDGRERVTEAELRLNAKGERRRTVNVPVDGEGREPTITVIAESPGRPTSPSASVKVRRVAPPPTEEKAVLRVLAVGVSDYQNLDEKGDLKYADKDATSLAEELKHQKGALYSDVLVQLFVDGKATRAAILRGLEWLGRDADQGKVVALILLSGHGRNTGGDFYFMPSNGDFADDLGVQDSGLAGSVLLTKLSELAKRAMVVLLVDACHSGTLVGAKDGQAPDPDVWAAELAKAENGVIVLTSSRGGQFSRELPDRRHGAFIAALLEALEGKGESDDGYIRVSQLGRFLASRVPELTRGAPTPQEPPPPWYDQSLRGDPPLFYAR